MSLTRTRNFRAAASVALLLTLRKQPPCPRTRWLFGFPSALAVLVIGVLSKLAQVHIGLYQGQQARPVETEGVEVRVAGLQPVQVRLIGKQAPAACIGANVQVHHKLRVQRIGDAGSDAPTISNTCFASASRRRDQSKNRCFRWPPSAGAMISGCILTSGIPREDMRCIARKSVERIMQYIVYV